MLKHASLGLVIGVHCLNAIGQAGIVTPVAAQARCPEGRLASGKCIDPALAQMGRETVVGMTQTKFSYTAPPFLPSQDRTSRLPLQTHEVDNLFTFPPVTKPITTILLPAVSGPPRPFQLNRP
jgi:hypothetical protein